MIGANHALITTMAELATQLGLQLLRENLQPEISVFESETFSRNNDKVSINSGDKG